MDPQNLRTVRTPRWSAIASALLGLALLVGCRELPRASLVDLEGVEAIGESQDGRFALLGKGFPTDRPASLELEGIVHRPGQGPSPVTARLTGHPLSAERIEFSLADDPALAELSPGQFEGHLALTFDAGTADVNGRLSGVRLWLRAGSSQARRDTLRAARHGSDWLASLGAGELEVDLERPGIRVGRVDAAGVADIAGLAPGDRIVALDDEPTADLADLWPAPGPGPARLVVERGAASSQVSLALPRAEGRRLRAAPSATTVAACMLVLLGVMLLWPVARSGPSAHAGGRPLHGLAVRGFALVVMLLGCALALVADTTTVHVLRGLLPVVLAYVACSVLATPRHARLEAWTQIAAQLAVACLSLATAALLSGTLSPSLHDANAGAEWPALVQPPGMCLLAMVHVALRTSSKGALARGFAAGARGVASFALVALMGGATLWEGASSPLSLVGLGVLCWLTWEWLLWRAAFSLVALGVVGAIGPVVAFAWFLAAPAQPIAATLSVLCPALALALSVRSLVVRLRLRLTHAAPLDPQLAPFL